MSNVCVNMIISVWHFEFPSTWVVWIGTLWCINHLKVWEYFVFMITPGHHKKKIYLTAHNMGSIFLLQFIGSRFDVCYMMPTILLCCWITLISVMYTRQIPIIEVAQSVVVVPYALLLIDLPAMASALRNDLKQKTTRHILSIYNQVEKKSYTRYFPQYLLPEKNYCLNINLYFRENWPRFLTKHH